ncbi:unnamed protein product, partial [Vitis vinifera]
MHLPISNNAKDFYARVGKSWKQGYLLYGLPGMGKSTMIAAMENMLLYDIYDLELMVVGDNTERPRRKRKTPLKIKRR